MIRKAKGSIWVHSFRLDSNRVEFVMKASLILPWARCAVCDIISACVKLRLVCFYNLFAKDKCHDIGVLLDRSRLAQIESCGDDATRIRSAVSIESTPHIQLLAWL